MNGQDEKNLPLLSPPFLTLTLTPLTLTHKHKLLSHKFSLSWTSRSPESSSPPDLDLPQVFILLYISLISSLPSFKNFRPFLYLLKVIFRALFPILFFFSIFCIWVFDSWFFRVYPCVQAKFSIFRVFPFYGLGKRWASEGFVVRY